MRSGVQWNSTCTRVVRRDQPRANGYEVGTNAFIHNPENRVDVSSYDKQQMTVNPDGSVDVYIGPTAPDGLTNNWIPPPASISG